MKLDYIKDALNQVQQDKTEVKEETEQLDEISGKLLGSYIQGARKDAQNKIAHGKELDELPKVKALKAKLTDYYGRKEYTKTGESKYRKQINSTHEKIYNTKKKADPSFPDSTNASPRFRGIEKAVKKLQYGKMTEDITIKEAADEENYHVDDTFGKMTAAEKARGVIQKQMNKRHELLKQVTRKVSRSNFTHDSSADDEEHAIEVNRKITAGADHPWIPKPITKTPAQAKTVSHGITTKQETKSSAGRKELQAALRAAKTPKEKAALRAQYRAKLGEEIEFSSSIEKDGAMYAYTLCLGEEVIDSGLTVTKVMAENIIDTRLDAIMESFDNQTDISDVLAYSKKYVSEAMGLSRKEIQMKKQKGYIKAADFFKMSDEDKEKHLAKFGQKMPKGKKK